MLPKRIWRTIFEVGTLLGAVACILTYLDIKPKDLAMSQSNTIPHALWLLLAVVLFAVGIGSSLWSGIVQKLQLNRLENEKHKIAEELEETQKNVKLILEPILRNRSSQLDIKSADYRAINGEGEVRNVTKAVKGQIDGNSLAFKITNSPLGMKEGDDLNFGERKRLTVTYSLDGTPDVTVKRWERDTLILPLDPQLQGLNDLQVKAIRIATASLALLNEIGPKPVPKYTELEISTMPEEHRLALLQSKDKDYADACDYYFGGPNVVVHESAEYADRLSKLTTTRYNFHRPWEAKLKARYEARFGEDLGHLRKALTGSDLAPNFPVVNLQEWDVETQIKRIAKEMWTLAFDLGKLNENS